MPHEPGRLREAPDVVGADIVLVDVRLADARGARLDCVTDVRPRVRARPPDEQSDPSANPVLRLVRRAVPVTDDFRGRRPFVREGGRRYGTPLLLVVVAIIVADIAFAVDSIPAAFAVTHDPVVIWTANAFALLGLGSVLAIVELLVRRLRYLNEAIALILGFVGLKILTADFVYISDLGSLAVIIALLAGGIVASLVADRLDPPHPSQQATRRPPRCPRQLAPPPAPPSRQASK